MIAPAIRDAVHTLAAQNTPLREITRLLKLSRNTVRRILRQPPPSPRTEPACDAHTRALLEAAFTRCRGNVVRVQEVLAHDHELTLAYTTLTRWVREAGLREPPRRAGTYTFAPGEEMQHDTSPHRLVLGGKPLTAQCAGLALAFSRRLFIGYYPRFTRFEAKAFLAEAFRFMDGTCPRCLIDNTSVLVASGSGPEATIAPEMLAFGRAFGVTFRAHRVGHPDRKARIERPFAYVEGNFIAGRTFGDWEDLNHQALAWCTQVANQKPKRALGMSPEAAYVLEKPHLTALPAHFPPVYECHERVVDLIGYISLDTNRYSVPERFVGKTVTVYKYPTEVHVLFRNQPIAKHPRLIGQREAKQTLPGHHTTPALHAQRRAPAPEERLLTGHHAVLDQYVAALKKRAPGRGVRALRRLLEMKRTYPEAPFLAALEQALRYGLYDLGRLEELVLTFIAGDFFELHTDEDE